MYFWGLKSVMKDPVSLLYEQFPYDTGKILASACGQAYVAIMLSNGRIGVCSTLGKPVETDPLLLAKPDLKIMDHRILATAFGNAQINYLRDDLGSGDIFDQIDFKKKQFTVMIGYFPPLVEKFRADGISLAVFDQQKDNPGLTPLSQLGEILGKSDCVIITSTTLINSSFSGLLSQIRPGSEINLLGPSTPLDPVLKEQFKVTRLFGMLFKPFDFEIMGLIGKGMGTQSFSKKSKKVSL